MESRPAGGQPPLARSGLAQIRASGCARKPHEHTSRPNIAKFQLELPPASIFRIFNNRPTPGKDARQTPKFRPLRSSRRPVDEILLSLRLLTFESLLQTRKLVPAPDKMASRPTVTVIGADGKATGATEVLPKVFSAPIRPDIVKNVHTGMAKNKRQPYSVSEKAGHQTSAESWGTGE